jgi:hypothetical protein
MKTNLLHAAMVAVALSFPTTSLAVAQAADVDAAAMAKPAMPEAHAAIVPLGFMAGTWVMEQARGAVIEEHWMAPAGNGMLGSFRRILGNGVIPFYEFTQIVADGDQVILRQIHVHGNFDTDPRRKDPMVLRLEKVEGTSASFVPLEDAKASNAGSLERVTYTLDDAGVLTVRVQERPRAAKEGEPAPEPQVIVLPMKRVR